MARLHPVLPWLGVAPRLGVALVLALCALPGRADAQAGLRSCLDENLPPPNRIAACSRIIQAGANEMMRGMALYGRAQARMDIVSAQPGEAPPAAYDPVLADLDLSYAAFRSEHALSLRATVRFFRGDLAPSLLPLFRNGTWEDAAEALGPMIAAAPGNPDLLMLRSTFRTMTGNQAGAREDRAMAVRIAGQAP